MLCAVYLPNKDYYYLLLVGIIIIISTLNGEKYFYLFNAACYSSILSSGNYTYRYEYKFGTISVSMNIIFINVNEIQRVPEDSF